MYIIYIYTSEVNREKRHSWLIHTPSQPLAPPSRTQKNITDPPRAPATTVRLGPGGTPPTLAGYARLAWFRLFIIRDPLSPPPRGAVTRPAQGILPAQDLPYRPGPRPTVAGLAPQRQLDQHGARGALAELTGALARLAAARPGRFGTATSCLEGHGFALFARHPVNVCGNGEVCHAHSSDGSLHLSLHPDDIAEVLAKGWGQRHPLAWGRGRGGGAPGHKGWLGWVTPRSPLPETFVLVYAPRGQFLCVSPCVKSRGYIYTGVGWSWKRRVAQRSD